MIFNVLSSMKIFFHSRSKKKKINVQIKSFFLLVLDNTLCCTGAIPITLGVHSMERHLVTRTQKEQTSLYVLYAAHTPRTTRMQ